MSNRYEWLSGPDDEPGPEQSVKIIAALGDWIEAHLAHVYFLNHKIGEISWPEMSVLLDLSSKEVTAKKADAKARAITNGYVWRMDLDP